MKRTLLVGFLLGCNLVQQVQAWPKSSPTTKQAPPLAQDSKQSRAKPRGSAPLVTPLPPTSSSFPVWAPRSGSSVSVRLSHVAMGTATMANTFLASAALKTLLPALERISTFFQNELSSQTGGISKYLHQGPTVLWLLAATSAWALVLRGSTYVCKFVEKRCIESPEDVRGLRLITSVAFMVPIMAKGPGWCASLPAEKMWLRRLDGGFRLVHLGAVALNLFLAVLWKW